MRIVRALPYVISAAALVLSSASCWYAIRAQSDTPSAAHKAPVETETGRLERLDADVNDLIRVCDMMSRRIRDANSLTVARLNRVEETAVGGLLLLEQRINTLTRHVGQDLAALQSQVAPSPTLRDDFEKAFTEQMARNLATPSRPYDPFSDAFHRELGRQVATPPPGVLDLMEGRSRR